ncbi:MAG: hypothetical protein AAF586_10035, partial [Planctomycetota bacterium]
MNPSETGMMVCLLPERLALGGVRSPAMTEMLGRVVDSKAFQNAVLGIILLAAIVVGLETSYTVMDAWGPWV